METELSVRSNTVPLPEWSDGMNWRELLRTEARADAWRIIEVFGEEGKPFDLHLVWSAGTRSGASADISVARATRLSLYARSLTLSVMNLSGHRNHVAVSVTDGYAPSANFWERRDHCDGISPVSMSVPPFATALTLQIANRSSLPGTLVSIFDGKGTLRAQFSGANLPDGGLRIGAASRIEILTPTPVDLRSIFHLSL